MEVWLLSQWKEAHVLDRHWDCSDVPMEREGEALEFPEPTVNTCHYYILTLVICGGFCLYGLYENLQAHFLLKSV